MTGHDGPKYAAAQGQGSWNRHWPFPEPTALYALWVIQSSDDSGLEISACLDMKNIGKPCTGIGVGRAFVKQKLAKPHARFEEGGQAGCSLLYPLIAALIAIDYSKVTSGVAHPFGHVKRERWQCRNP